MARQWLVAGVALVASCGVLGACGGGGTQDEPRAAPSASPSEAPATITPTTPEPVVTTQPPGANGVTWRIRDWDKYQNDPAVIGWTHIHEDLAASINQGKLVPGLEQRVSNSVLRTFVKSVDVSKTKDYQVPIVGDVKVLRSTTDGDRASLTMCMWSTTTGIRDKNDKAVGDDEDIWFKQESTLSSVSGRWVLKTLDDSVGTCTGGPPA